MFLKWFLHNNDVFNIYIPISGTCFEYNIHIKYHGRGDRNMKFILLHHEVSKLMSSITSSLCIVFSRATYLYDTKIVHSTWNYSSIKMKSISVQNDLCITAAELKFFAKSSFSQKLNVKLLYLNMSRVFSFKSFLKIFMPLFKCIQIF